MARVFEFEKGPNQHLPERLIFKFIIEEGRALHQIPLVAALLVPSIWAVGDFLALVAGKFRDGAGEWITRWI